MLTSKTVHSIVRSSPQTDTDSESALAPRPAARFNLRSFTARLALNLKKLFLLFDHESSRIVFGKRSLSELTSLQKPLF